MSLYYIGMVLLSFITMEFIAWFMHKYVMHGMLWFLHRDHHQVDPNHFFERNDFFFLIFAIPGIVGLYLGVQNEINYMFYVGLGVTLYGFAYFMVHDIFIHQRFRIFRKSDSIYFRAIRKAHKVHHKHLGKDQGECFGMLWVPIKYFKEARRATKR